MAGALPGLKKWAKAPIDLLEGGLPNRQYQGHDASAPLLCPLTDCLVRT